MDILDDVLNTIDLRGTLYFRTNFSEPWSVRVPQHKQAARFHLVVQGRSYFHIGMDHQVELAAGDLILIPNGASHIIADQQCDHAPELETVLQDVGYTGDGVLIVGEGNTQKSTQMVCGHFTFRAKAEHMFLKALPSYIVVTAGVRAQNTLLDASLRLMSSRIFKGALGADATIRRLSEIIFIELLRLGIGQQDEVQSMFKALKDPKISQSLHLIHTLPAAPWTLETLAVEVAMSRSRFAERFKRLVGTSPMSYLSNWRLQKALALIGDTNQSIQQVAKQTGYQSPSAFTRAFQDKFGMAPKEYRVGFTSSGYG